MAVRVVAAEKAARKVEARVVADRARAAWMVAGSMRVASRVVAAQGLTAQAGPARVAALIHPRLAVTVHALRCVRVHQ